MERAVAVCRAFRVRYTRVASFRSNPTISGGLERRFQRPLQLRGFLSDAVARRVEVLSDRHDEIVELINTAAGDTASLGKELSMLTPVVILSEKLSEFVEEERSLDELLRDAELDGDREMQREINTELDRLEGERDRIERKIVEVILPRDQDDFAADAVLEIRSGTGGDEAALFAAELLDAYIKEATGRGWSTEILSVAKTDLKGIKEAALSISRARSYGAFQFDIEDDVDRMSQLGPYGLFKYESGVHRVQRVPINDVRIHTSACSVAVLPSPEEADASDKLLPLSELKIETMRASGAGGQHVNTTDSAVRITHIPTGITAAIQDERSQHKNKAKALKLVTARVRDLQRSESDRERGEARSSLMGCGDRSERIRTYNYPQDRVTDHRCKQAVTKLLSGGMNGLATTFVPFMMALRKEHDLKQLEEDECP